jgi:hypothetical protein
MINLAQQILKPHKKKGQGEMHQKNNPCSSYVACLLAGWLLCYTAK